MIARDARRLILSAVLVVDAAALVYPAVDAALRRERRDETLAARIALAEVLGSPDLALSSSSRWLRHPTSTEPGAAFADGPATLDVDPGGAFIPPPASARGAR